VGSPVFDGLGPTRSDPANRAYEVGEMLGGLLASRHPVSDDQGTKFAEALEALIDDLLRGTTYGVSLGVDYAPDRDLADAAQATGISLSRFPWKTNMWVKADHVTVSAGYAAPVQIVWHAPDWQRPTCDQRLYVNGESRDELCSLPIYHEGDHGEYRPDPARCATCGQGYSIHYSQSAYASPNRHPFPPVD